MPSGWSRAGALRTAGSGRISARVRGFLITGLVVIKATNFIFQQPRFKACRGTNKAEWEAPFFGFSDAKSSGRAREVPLGSLGAIGTTTSLGPAVTGSQRNAEPYSGDSTIRTIAFNAIAAAWTSAMRRLFR
jgi:hypothetical protein